MSPGLIRQVYYRPSSYSRFLARYRLLEGDEVDTFVSLISENNPKQLPHLVESTSVASRARILDTALEYFDYKEKLSGADTVPVLYVSLRKPILEARAQTKVAPESIAGIPEKADPVSAHDTGRIGLSFGFSEARGALTRFEWRPALHDMANNTWGYSDGLEIRFMDTQLHYEWLNQKLRLSHLGIFEVFSLAPIRPLITSISWRLSLAIDSENRCGDIDQCTVKHVEGGAGLAVNPISKIPVTIFALGVADIGSSTETGLNFYGAPGVRAGTLCRFSDNLKFSAQGIYFYRIGTIKRNHWVFSTDLVYSIQPRLELRTKAMINNNDTEYGLASYYFF